MYNKTITRSRISLYIINIALVTNNIYYLPVFITTIFGFVLTAFYIHNEGVKKGGQSIPPNSLWQEHTKNEKQLQGSYAIRRINPRILFNTRTESCMLYLP